jgi:hypothetical protein
MQSFIECQRFIFTQYEIYSFGFQIPITRIILDYIESQREDDVELMFKVIGNYNMDTGNPKNNTRAQPAPSIHNSSSIFSPLIESIHKRNG